MTGRAAEAAPEGERGTIFIEALVATAIVAMILAATFQIAAESAARRHGLEARRYALMVARSELAAVGSATPLAPGVVEGVDDDQAWRVSIQPCGAGGFARSAGVQLYCVQVSAGPAGGGAPLITLSSRRLAPLA